MTDPRLSTNPRLRADTTWPVSDSLLDALAGDRPLRRAWRRLRRSRSARLGGILVATMTLLAAAGSWIAPHPPDARDRTVAALSGPSSRHWLGVDANEKDVFSRVVYGGRLSLLAGVISIAVAVLIGVPVGVIAGYFSGWLDTLLMRAIDVALAFPSLLIALLVTAAYRPGWTAVIFAVGLINVPMIARQVRVTVMSIRELDYVRASRAAGTGTLGILCRVILPGIVNPVIVLATMGLGTAILEVAGLSFLGVGGDPTVPEWGSMLAQAKDHLSRSVWPALGPGAAISAAILGCNLLGDGVRDALDVRLE